MAAPLPQASLGVADQARRATRRYAAAFGHALDGGQVSARSREAAATTGIRIVGLALLKLGAERADLGTHVLPAPGAIGHRAQRLQKFFDRPHWQQVGIVTARPTLVPQPV